MKSFGIIAASALFGAVANAAPLNKRDVVWVTEIETDIVTVPVTMTVWADAAETTVATTTTQSRHGHQFFHSKAPKASTTSTSVYVAPTTSSTSVYVAPTPSTTSVYVAPTPSTTSVYVAPSTSSSEIYVAPTTSSTEVYVAPTTSSTSVYVAPTTSSVYVAPETTSTYVAPTIESTSVYVAPTTSTTSSAPAATTSSSSSGSSSGPAASGTEYSGDLTWYDVGLGACGLTSTSDEAIVAISQKIFDSPDYATANPNLNPLCGKYVTIKGKTGESYQAKVVDRCVGCAEADLDLSQDFFNTVTSNGDGRVSGMSWSWN
ncbi:hypothetical protein E4T50_14126 [Aureobasidium sp. EXF-12298]|nr:hypothetical protein E4T50_14126 [Aureobasidium sp. EXF-12298]KAI4753244.1 hypothetical protein E4T51_13606 [Aureobasidium sp. EXF-12344]KAI4770321.1 hypothetical protein E4T52_14653 [Aureobasidium sp. EXF-3400]